MEYEVEIDRIRVHRATVRVNAASASEAKRKATELASSDGVRWQQIDEQLEAVGLIASAASGARHKSDS